MAFKVSVMEMRMSGQNAKSKGKFTQWFIILFIAYVAWAIYNDDRTSEERSIDMCFNHWDGSIPVLVDYLKEHLRDPDSFEHISTKYGIKDNGDIGALMEYRAKNGFGGMTVGKTIAVIKPEGCRIISVQ